jgi:acyl carrier protein
MILTVTESALRGVLATALAVAVSDIGDDASMDTIDVWDSLKQLQIVLALEASFGISLGDEEALEVTSLDLIRSAIERHGVAVTAE